ncbi:MAG: hypothetical protein H6Q65_983 [Firmicutes bacterium]|nr:hypothetical protein [Bacillota bacterium]
MRKGWCIYMPYVCEPYKNEIAGLQTERKELEEQLKTAGADEKAGILARIAEIDHELPGLQQSLADCLAHPEHFKDVADPGDPRKH